MNFSKFFSKKKKRKKNKLRTATANELKIKRNASDLWTVRHFFSPAIFLLSARDKNRSRTIFGDGGCVSVANYSHVSRREQIRGGKKYRSNVTVPSETEYSLFFFFLFGSVTHLQSARQKREIAKIYKALRRRIGEKNALTC